MIILTDTFNGRKISAHRTIKAAVKAKLAHLRAVKKANGPNSYLTYGFIEGGKPVDSYLVEQAEHEWEISQQDRLRESR